MIPLLTFSQANVTINNIKGVALMLIYTENEIKATPFSKLSVFSYTNIVHKHTFYELTIILRGTANSSINGGSVRQLQEGDMIIVCPEDFHSIQPKTKDYRHRDFYITKSKMKKLNDLFGDNFLFKMLNSGHENYYRLDIEETNLIEKKSSAFELQSDPSSEMHAYLDKVHTTILAEIFGCIFTKALPATNMIPQWLNDLYLHLTSFHYVSFSIDEIIRRTGYSHSYVCQIFKKTFNMTMRDCLTRSKIILSANLLGEEKIIDIATSFGWENPKNYSIAFKKVFGVTPQQYKKQRTKKISSLYPDPPKMEKLDDFEKIVEP